MTDNIITQFSQICDTIDLLGVILVVYFFLRLSKYERSTWRELAFTVAFPVAYFAVILFMSLNDKVAIAERYYRPVLPFLVILMARGLWSFRRDVKRKWIFGGVLCVFLLGSFYGIFSQAPIRAHRLPQMKAGRWLKEYDPDYAGFVMSDYTQPVYAADMVWLPADKQLCEGFLNAGYKVRYCILEDDAQRKYPEVHKWMESDEWRKIYTNEEREIKIFRCSLK